jgi:hypothetical protein
MRGADLREELGREREEVVATKALFTRGRKRRGELKTEREGLAGFAIETRARSEIHVSETCAVRRRRDASALQVRFVVAVHHERDRHPREHHDPIEEPERQTQRRVELMLHDPERLRVALTEIVLPDQRVVRVVEVKHRAVAQVPEIGRTTDREVVLHRLRGSKAVERRRALREREAR